MNRRTIVAIGSIAAIGAASAAVLGVSTSATAVPVEDQAISVEGTQQSFYGTAVFLPNNIAAFHLDEAGQLVSVGDISELSQETLDGITAQLAAAPAQSVMYVDLGSEDADGLTTAIATVTPTEGHLIGGTNAELQAWLTGLFPETAGTPASQDIPNIPNASYTYSHTEGELTWQVTEYLFQFSDATVSVHLSTVDTTGATQAQFDQMLATMTR